MPHTCWQHTRQASSRPMRLFARCARAAYRTPPIAALTVVVLARRCRGSDIYQICLAGRNQWPCPVGPHPRPTSCTPGPARRACLAVSRIRIRRARPSRRRLRTPESTSTVRDGAIPAPRRLSRVAWYPCWPWGSNPPPAATFHLAARSANGSKRPPTRPRPPQMALGAQLTTTYYCSPFLTLVGG